MDIKLNDSKAAHYVLEYIRAEQRRAFKKTLVGLFCSVCRDPK